MELVTVRLERVFDVVHSTHNNDDHTLFSIEVGGRKEFGLKLSGRLELENGALVSAVLERDGDWQSLLAMRVHPGAKIYRQGIALSASLLINACIGFLFVCALLGQLFDIPPLGFALLASVFVCAMGQLLVYLAGRRRKITRLLAQAAPPG